MAEIQKKNNTPEQSGFPGRRQLGQGCRIGEYSIVKKLSENVEGFVYLAQDSILGDMVQIKEFFPEEMAVRGNLPENGEELSGSDALQPLEGCAAKFKYFRACFQDLYSTLRQERDNECLLPILQIASRTPPSMWSASTARCRRWSGTCHQVGGKESWCRAKQYLLPLYNSLSNLHKAGIIHQCISPDNILLDDEGSPFWRDFFLSEMHTEESQQLASGYAAPEQYQQGGWSGVWTDVYSIAAVTYRVLTGITPPDALRRQQRDTLCPARQLDESIEPNISQALWDAMKLPSAERCDSVGALTARMLDSADSNTMVFQVESDVTEQTVHLDSLPGPVCPQAAKPGSGRAGAEGAALPRKAGGHVPGHHHGGDFTCAGGGECPSCFAGPATDGARWEKAPPRGSSRPTPTTSSSCRAMPQRKRRPMQWIALWAEGRRRCFPTATMRSGTTSRPRRCTTRSSQEGFIVDQSLDPGEEISRRTSITLYVSKGSEMEPMPNLIGKTAEEAVAQLTEMNKRYQLVEGTSDEVNPGEVFRTDPAAGTELKKDENDLVLLYVAQEQAQTEDEQTEEEDGVQILSQKNSDRKVIRKKDTTDTTSDTTTDDTTDEE